MVGLVSFESLVSFISEAGTFSGTSYPESNGENVNESGLGEGSATRSKMSTKRLYSEGQENLRLGELRSRLGFGKGALKGINAK